MTETQPARQRAHRVLRDERVHFTRPEFRPYATALGQLALAWNGLHERLAFLFCMVMGGGQVNHFFAVWYAVKNDRAQRDMLLASAKVDISNLSSWSPKMLDEITWIYGKCNEVEEVRNNALHSPLILMRRGPDERIVEPAYHMGHERAIKLARKQNLMVELRWCRNAATVLSQYTYEIDGAMEGRGSLWPDRPRWPTREETKSKKPRQEPRPTG
jgi:hypothetical protein